MELIWLRQVKRFLFFSVAHCQRDHIRRWRNKLRQKMSFDHPQWDRKLMFKMKLPSFLFTPVTHSSPHPVWTDLFPCRPTCESCTSSGRLAHWCLLVFPHHLPSWGKPSHSCVLTTFSEPAKTLHFLNLLPSYNIFFKFCNQPLPYSAAYVQTNSIWCSCTYVGLITSREVTWGQTYILCPAVSSWSNCTWSKPSRGVTATETATQNPMPYAWLSPFSLCMPFNPCKLWTLSQYKSTTGTCLFIFLVVLLLENQSNREMRGELRGSNFKDWIGFALKDFALDTLKQSSPWSCRIQTTKLSLYFILARKSRDPLHFYILSFYHIMQQIFTGHPLYLLVWNVGIILHTGNTAGINSQALVAGWIVALQKLLPSGTQRFDLIWEKESFQR